MNNTSIEIYTERSALFAADLAVAEKASNTMSQLRLVVFLISFGGFLWFIFQDQLIPSLAFVFIGIGIFVFLMIRHEKIQVREKKSRRLLEINTAGLLRSHGKWNSFPVTGAEFIDEKHPYSSDLDLFGTSSLFQWLNAAQTKWGKIQLRDLLIQSPRKLDEIQKDQKSILELAAKLDWRQRFQSEGHFSLSGKNSIKENPEALLEWAEDKTEIFSNLKGMKLIRYLPIISISFALYSFFILHSTALMTLPFIIHIVIAAWNQKRSGIVLNPLANQIECLSMYQSLIKNIESENFTAPSLLAIQDQFRNSTGAFASGAIGKLKTITEMMATRQNPILNFLVNALCLWDIQWLFAIRKWRFENGTSLRSWLSGIAKVESLSSLSIVANENPNWIFPELEVGNQVLSARKMAHPLLPAESRVGNTVSIGKPGEILIITGSNMSGKSTLMRTIGINLVLAYAGAPVCAEAFSCATLELHTSMRLRDDLEKRISSFYAELLRIKDVVEAARAGRKVLFLVDEIFRGTNSKDRHAGAIAVLKQLHDLKAAGLVSTHDLELAQLENTAPEFFHNYHFQESYADGKIHFDFLIREGVSKTSNAMHLLKMVGLG